LADYISRTTPSNPSAGETWFNPDTDKFRVYQDGAWRDITSHAAVHDVGGAQEISDLASHEARHEIGGADELGEWLSVKRDLTGSVVFEDIAAGLTSGTTATSTTVSTATSVTGQILATQAVLSLTGAFTTATATLLRNASTLATLTATGTTTVSSLTTLTGTNTWTAQVHMATGTSATAGLTARRDSRVTVVPR